MFVFAALISATAFGGNTFIANNASGHPGETGVLVQVGLNNDD